MLREDAVLAAVLDDVGLDLVGVGLPALRVLARFPEPREPGAAVARDPAHDLRADEVLVVAADLPDAAVGQPPVLDRRLHEPLDQRPAALGQMVARLGVQEDRVQHRAPHVVLALVVGAVADPYRAGVVVAAEVIERVLEQLALALDAVQV